jgi:hypothetical protein
MKGFWFGIYPRQRRHRTGPWFGVEGLGFGVWSFGFEVLGLGFGVWGLGFGVRSLRFEVWGLGFGVWGVGLGIRGLGSGVWGLGSTRRSELQSYLANSKTPPPLGPP